MVNSYIHSRIIPYWHGTFMHTHTLAHIELHGCMHSRPQAGAAGQLQCVLPRHGPPGRYLHARGRVDAQNSCQGGQGNQGRPRVRQDVGNGVVRVYLLEGVLAQRQGSTVIFSCFFLRYSGLESTEALRVRAVYWSKRTVARRLGRTHRTVSHTRSAGRGCGRRPMAACQS